MKIRRLEEQQSMSCWNCGDMRISKQCLLMRDFGRWTVMEHIKNLGYQRISIGVEATDMADIHLYKRLGFTGYTAAFSACRAVKRQ